MSRAGIPFLNWPTKHEKSNNTIPKLGDQTYEKSSNTISKLVDQTYEHQLTTPVEREKKAHQWLQH